MKELEIEPNSWFVTIRGNHVDLKMLGIDDRYDGKYSGLKRIWHQIRHKRICRGTQENIVSKRYDVRKISFAVGKENTGENISRCKNRL